MFKKIFCLILILKLSQARYSFVPKFFGQDSAIIVDVGKTVIKNKDAPTNFPNKIRMPPPFPLWRHYPRYHIIPPPPPGQILAINTWAKMAKATTTRSSTSTTTTSTTTTTTSTTPKPTITTSTYKPATLTSQITGDEFPAELLDIAQKKLGLNSLDEIPSITELGQLLGTSNPEETLDCIKQLTLNEQGVALMKAYIESTDYTDNTNDFDIKNDDLENEEEEEDEVADIEDPFKSNDNDLVVITDNSSNDDYELNNEEEETEDNTTNTILNLGNEMTQNIPSFMERMADYMQLNNLFHKSVENNETMAYNQLSRITENGKKVYNKENQSTENEENQTESEGTKDSNTQETPILVRESIPYNYPVPIRVQTTTKPPSTANTAVHLNTPKMLIPHVQQLARVTKIPPKQIEDFLAGKPKLLELATKVSHFPINYDRNSPIEAQIIAAVQKAFEQDDDLKKLLNSTATLK